jgi:hypothetical protein
LDNNNLNPEGGIDMGKMKKTKCPICDADSLDNLPCCEECAEQRIKELEFKWQQAQLEIIRLQQRIIEKL